MYLYEKLIPTYEKYKKKGFKASVIESISETPRSESGLQATLDGNF